jgi:dTDP-4-amino-4,6-dideoxygalactose transaminase
MHKQGAFIGTRSVEADCPNTEMLCNRVLCLPIHPYLTDEEVRFVAEKLKENL